MLRLLVADRNEFSRAGIAALLSNAGHDIIEARAAEDLFKVLASHDLDLAILSYDLFDRTEEDLWSRLSQNWPSLRVILLLNEPGHVRFSNADGIILKNATVDQLIACIDSVSEGRRWADPTLLNWLFHEPKALFADGRLTPREVVVSGLIARGLRNKEIARDLQVSEATVKMHLHNVYYKLRLNGRTELALRARDLLESTRHRSEPLTAAPAGTFAGKATRAH